MGELFCDWIGRTQTCVDTITPAPLRGLAALLDYDAPPWGEVAPELAHWLYFLPVARQRDIGADGHPKRGGFLPPVALPRRMWAGGRVTFHAPLRVGASVERVSTIKAITAKSGASGEMVFVTVAHDLRVAGVAAVSEEQDIVYRAAAGPSRPPAPGPAAAAGHTRTVTPDEVQLFRFSALTFNAHRIHFDRGYAMKVEGYPGLVVQGPLIATWLLDHYRRVEPTVTVRSFSFRAQAPLFDGRTATLCAGADGELWACDETGRVAMSARVEAG